MDAAPRDDRSAVDFMIFADSKKRRFDYAIRGLQHDRTRPFPAQKIANVFRQVVKVILRASSLAALSLCLLQMHPREE